MTKTTILSTNHHHDDDDVVVAAKLSCGRHLGMVDPKFVAFKYKRTRPRYPPPPCSVVGTQGTTTTNDNKPPYSWLVPTNQIVHRALDGEHDNVLAISMMESLLDKEDKEAEAPQQHPTSRVPPTSNSTSIRTTALVVVLQYELETHEGKVYQRTHVVSSFWSTTTITTRPPGWSDWWPWTLAPLPVWIESTHVSPTNKDDDDGDVHVALAGLGAVLSSTTTTTSSANPTQQRSATPPENGGSNTVAEDADHPRDDDDDDDDISHFSRHRRFLCTIRVGIVVQQPRGTVPLATFDHGSRSSSNDNDKNNEQLHSLIDVAAMVTSESPVIVVHVGWFRKGLHALNLTGNTNHQDDSDDKYWDIYVEDALCQDPNNGYQLTHTFMDGDNNGGGGRRRLFADNMHKAHDSSRLLEKNHSISTTEARKLLSQPPTQEELQVHDEMRMGRRPVVHRDEVGSGDVRLRRRRQVGNDKREPHRFLLIHGYCTNYSWPTNDFTSNAYTVVEFNDPFVGKSNDNYAYTIRESACPYEEDKITGNIVAHSQGGPAALHMKNFYWSCLDNNPYPGKWIQTLGAPFQGTNLAGVASARKIAFGVGCGTIHDITEAGATEWLRHMEPWARQRVTYYRTRYGDQSVLFNYCHLVTHALIGEPNDGVVQLERGILPGGVDGGVTLRQCHGPDMRDPPQLQDHGRNALMKRMAAAPNL
ncbi:hypothetical protein ACA910_009829 [Epithemia clementina (nom. ined.)]